MKKNKGFTPILIVLIIVGVLALGGGTYYFLVKKPQKPVGCTQEAKICPDGSAVGRTGPNCEFAECPTVKTDETADWKTYRNVEYWFELSYSPWKEVSTSSTYSNNSIATYLIPVEYPLSQIIFIYRKSANQSLNSWYNNNFPNNKDIISGPIATTINGYNALEEISLLSGFYRKSVFLEKNELIIEFFFDLDSKTDKIPSDRQKILDSFKFLD